MWTGTFRRAGPHPAARARARRAVQRVYDSARTGQGRHARRTGGRSRVRHTGVRRATAVDARYVLNRSFTQWTRTLDHHGLIIPRIDVFRSANENVDTREKIRVLR